MGKKDVLQVTLKIISVSLKYPLWTNLEGSTKKGEVFDFLDKYMEGYDLKGARIFNVDNSSTSTVQKMSENLVSYA
jgi:hypothetical protein